MGRLDFATFLVDKAAEVNANEGGCNCLGFTAGKGHLELVISLLDHSAKAINEARAHQSRSQGITHGYDDSSGSDRWVVTQPGRRCER